MKPWPVWAAALAGLAAGGLTMVLVPDRHLFVRDDAHAHAATGERWACPMMDYLGDHPGTCPVCGMQMERMQAGAITREQARRMGLATVRVERAPALLTVRASGLAAYDDRFTQVVIPRLPGRIVKRHPATFGCCQDIAAGEPIIDIYSPLAFQAQAELAATVKQGDRAMIAGLVARFERWNLKHVADAILAGGQPSDTITITSPTAGQAWQADPAMVDQALMVGQEVMADTPLLRIVDAAKLTLVVQVPESQAVFLSTGQRVALSSDDRGDLPGVEAVIGRLGNEIDPVLRTREVRIYLADGRRSLNPGALVTARIQAALGPDLAPTGGAPGEFPVVPKTAILSTGVRHLVWRVKHRQENGRIEFEPVAVALGPRLESPDGRDRYVVRAGLAVGDEVAGQGAFLVDAQAQLAGSPSLLLPDGITGGAVKP
jgi:Cu(I)/Ag(I) efflux system membrane fusion protein